MLLNFRTFIVNIALRSKVLKMADIRLLARGVMIKDFTQISSKRNISKIVYKKLKSPYRKVLVPLNRAEVLILTISKLKQIRIVNDT
jgi:hypothetical protein